MNKKIVCWIGDASHHRALICKLAAVYDIAGVVIDMKKKLAVTTGLPVLWKKFIHKIRFGRIDHAWKLLQQHYRQEVTEWPTVPTLHVKGINTPEALEFTKALQPDLVIVSGTSLIKEPMVSMPLPVGIMNLHTGLSPYVKGGPNCTNWCIANNQWGMIGNTVLWLSAGIDSGNIITSERIDVSAEKELPAIHLKVMEHAHDLYLRAIRYVINASAPLQSVPQSSIGKGSLYLTKMWTNNKKRQLLRNLAAKRSVELPAGLKTIPLPG